MNEETEKVISLAERGCYFLTLETIDLVDIFIRPVYKRIIVHTLNHFVDTKGLIVYGWCLMPNRLYIICQVVRGVDLNKVRNDFKEFTAEKIVEAIMDEPQERRAWLLDHFQKSVGFLNNHKKVVVWKKIREDAILNITRPEIIAEQLEWMHNAPVQERIVEYVGDYLYSSAKDYETGMEGYVKITRPVAVQQFLEALESRKSTFKALTHH